MYMYIHGSIASDANYSFTAMHTLKSQFRFLVRYVRTKLKPMNVHTTKVICDKQEVLDCIELQGSSDNKASAIERLCSYIHHVP